MSLNTSPLGIPAMQISLGDSNGLPGPNLQNAVLNSMGARSTDETINQLAGALTAMMMMMNIMGGSGLGGGLGTAGGALGGQLGGALGTSLGGTGGAGSSLGQALGLDPTADGGGLSGSNGTYGMSPMDQLMKMFAEVMQSMFGGQGDTSGRGNGNQPTPNEQNAYTKGVTDSLTAVMGGGLSQMQGSGTGGGMNGSIGFGNGLGGKGLQELNGPADFEQLGVGVGTGVGMKAGIEALNNIGTESDSSTRTFINKEDRGLAKEVGQFMDQYPETFGKPQYQKTPYSEVKTDTKSWAEALSDPDDDGMTPASMEQFNKAKGMIKSAMAGDTGNSNLQARGDGGSSLAIDATITGDVINNMALGKLGTA
ncbi:harpin HrpZ family protein [Pantoea sp. paga]|uniref:harpin HrpZ family protein n=1 Tax=Pantoea sp. paga TaxID=2597519 RepID=UPI00117CA401|nr:harpin HrpZ family protein [Pantoea sp. paga]TSH78318.1 type III secretion protein HrpN [Pantoea sp. paga]